jgi:hypothetical protein
MILVRLNDAFWSVLHSVDVSFWVVKSCGLVSEEHTAFIFMADDTESNFFEESLHNVTIQKTNCDIFVSVET